MILGSTVLSGSSLTKGRGEGGPGAARPKGKGIELRGDSQATLPFLPLLISHALEDETLHQRIESANQDEEC
jgi:hypothetical protein